MYKTTYKKLLNNISTEDAFSYLNLSYLNKKKKLIWELLERNDRLVFLENLKNQSKKYIGKKNKKIGKNINDISSVIEYVKLNKHYIIQFHRKKSNMYISLTNINGRTVLYRSSGQMRKGNRSRKLKITHLTIYPVMKLIVDTIKKHKVRNIIILIKMALDNNVVMAIKYLKFFKLKVFYTFIGLLRPLPHHFGRRTKKIRRI